MTQSFVVGFASIVVAIYNLILSITHIRIKHDVVKRVSKISYAASILLCLSVFSITLSYYVPTIGGHCFCKTFFSTALILYVLSIFLMKFMYLERVKVFNEEPILSYVSIYIDLLTKLVNVDILAIYLKNKLTQIAQTLVFTSKL